MKKKTEKILSTAMAAMMVISLASCKKDSTTTADGKTVVKMWTLVNSDSSQRDKDDLERMKKALAEKFDDIQVEFIAKSNVSDYRQEYDKALMAGEAPDIYYQFSYTDIPARIKNGTVADITKYVDNWQMKKDDLVINTFDSSISSDGKWYAIPRSSYMQATLVNKKVLTSLGKDINNLPATWDEFTKLGSEITDVSVPRFGYELMGMDWCAWPFTAWVWSAGGEMVTPNDDGTYKISFNEEPGVDAAVLLNEMIWKYKMTQKNVLSDLSELRNDIQNGTAVFSWESTDNIVNAEAKEKYGTELTDYVSMPMPVKDSSIARPALAGGEVITFNPKADEKTLEAAFRVADFLYYDEEYLTDSWTNAAKDGSVDTQMPGRKDLYEKKLEIYGVDEDNINAFKEMSKNAIAEPSCNNWSDLKSALVNPLQEIFLTENISRDKVKELLDKCANDLYEAYPDTFKR